LLLLQRSIESDDGHWLSGGDDSKDRPPSPVMTAEYEDEECEERCDDNVSETGTYTIGKDSASPDEDQSRRDIDRIFGLIPQTPTAPTSAEGATAINGQGDTSLDNRSTPQWIREWAAQVAQQQEAPLAHLLVGQVGLSKPPSHPRPPPPDLPTSQRPRRRLPSVPSAVTSNGSSRSRSSPRPSDMSDPSDSSLETESFLRDTESVVSAMQVHLYPCLILSHIELHLMITVVIRLEWMAVVALNLTLRLAAVAVIAHPSTSPSFPPILKIVLVFFYALETNFSDFEIFISLFLNLLCTASGFFLTQFIVHSFFTLYLVLSVT